MKCKCKGCTERRVGCHSECLSYLAFKRHQEEMNRKKLESNYYNEQKELYRNKRLNKYGHGR